MTKATPRSKAIQTLQKLRRLEEADHNGYCRCVTCGGQWHWKEIDAGHFIPKGNSSYWALEKMNIWPQCKYDNNWGMKYGTSAAAYTIFMQDKYGAGTIRNMLDSKKKIKKISKAEYKEMIEEWNSQIREHLKRIGE